MKFQFFEDHTFMVVALYFMLQGLSNKDKIYVSTQIGIKLNGLILNRFII